MKRFLFVCVVALMVGVAVAAAASPPRARLSGFVCQHALDPPSRTVSVVAVMRPLPGTRKLEVRFNLQEKTKLAGAFSAIHGGDLGTWLSPTSPATLGQRPGDVWMVYNPVSDLPAPAAYRFRVSFRWTGAHGHVLGTAERLSAVCYQPELRPDLLVQSISVAPIAGKPAKNAYVVVIRNDGATAAGPFELLFAPGGGFPSETRVVQQLGPHGTHQATFAGPACTTLTAPTVTADPTALIDDFDRANNSLTATCPTSAP